MAMIIPFPDQTTFENPYDKSARLAMLRHVARDISLKLQKDISFRYQHLLKSRRRCHRFQRWLTNWLNTRLLDVDAYRSCEQVVTDFYDEIKDHVKIHSSNKEDHDDR